MATGRDVQGGYKAMLIAYRRNGGVIEAVAGTEASSTRFFVLKSNAATAADAETRVSGDIQKFRAKHAAPSRCIVSTRETGRGAAKDTWKVEVKCPGNTFGFPKGGQKDTDLDAAATAIREFREEIGVDLSGTPLKDENDNTRSVNGTTYYIYSVDVTGNDAAINSQITAGYFNELFDIRWVDINNLPANANAPTKKAADLLKTQLSPAPAPVAQGLNPNAAVFVPRGAVPVGPLVVPSPGKYIPPHLRNKQPGGRKTRRTGRSKLGTKKRHTRGRGGKTRRTQ